MVVDIGEVKRRTKPKADSTLRNMRKDDLIKYIRCLEHNYNVAVSFNENQAKYIESLKTVEVCCKDCRYYSGNGYQKCRLHSTEPDQYGSGADVCMEPDDFCSYGERRADHETDKSG